MRLQDQPDVMSVEEAAQVLRIGRGSVYDAIARGEVPAVRIGRRILIPRARLEAFLGDDNKRQVDGPGVTE